MVVGGWAYVWARVATTCLTVVDAYAVSFQATVRYARLDWVRGEAQAQEGGDIT